MPTHLVTLHVRRTPARAVHEVLNRRGENRQLLETDALASRLLPQDDDDEVGQAADIPPVVLQEVAVEGTTRDVMNARIS